MNAVKTIAEQQLSEVKSQVKALEETTKRLDNQLNTSDLKDEIDIYTKIIYTREPFFINTRERLTKFIAGFGETLPEALENFHYWLMEYHIDSTNWATWEGRESELSARETHSALYFFGAILRGLHPIKRKGGTVKEVAHGACIVLYEHTGRFDSETFSEKILQALSFSAAVTFANQDLETQNRITSMLLCFR